MAEGREVNGYFAKGNRLWEARERAGLKPIYETPEQLWEACVGYFEWVEANPLQEDKLVTFQGAATHEPVAKMRAMTIEGLSIFLGITARSWRNWRDERPDLVPVMERVEQIIWEQKFTGASADLLNANIIARDLGLSDKTEVTGKEGGAIETKDVSMSDTARGLAFILAAAIKEKDE